MMGKAQYLRLDDFSMTYEDHGEGLPALFIHGFPLNRKLWEPQIKALSSHARILAPDLRGHGETTPLSGAYSMTALADDCHALLEALVIDRPVVVCGLSMGGYVAFEFYRQNPKRVAGMILAATRAGVDTPEGKSNREKVAAKAEEQGTGAVVADLLPKMMSPKTTANNRELVAWVESMMLETSVEGIAGASLGMKDRPDSRELLPQIRVPVLILHGEDDQLFPPSEAEAMHSAIKKSRLVILPDAGHLLNLEQPDLFNQAVLQFLETLA